MLDCTDSSTFVCEIAETVRTALPDCSADSSSFVCAVVDFLQTLRG